MIEVQLEIFHASRHLLGRFVAIKSNDSLPSSSTFDIVPKSLDIHVACFVL